jgi:hypothetical protein
VLLLLATIGSRAAAQADTAAGRCSTPTQARPDSMVPVDTAPRPERLTPMAGGPQDAPRRAVIAHFVVTADGQVDTSTVAVEHTRDAAWIARLRHNLAQAIFTPGWRDGCRVPHWSTFAVVWVRP